MNSSNDFYNILIPTYNNPTNNLTQTIKNGSNLINIIDANNFTYEISIEYYGEMNPFIPLDNFIGMDVESQTLSSNSDVSHNIFTNNYKRRLYQTSPTSWYINNISTIQDVSKIFSVAVKYNDVDISLNTDYSNNVISLNDIIDDTDGISTDILTNKLLYKLFYRHFITDDNKYNVLFDIEYMYYNSDNNNIVRKKIYNTTLNNIQLMINNNIFYNINDDIYRELYLLDDVRIIDEFKETSTYVYYWMNRNGSIRINYPEQEHSKIYVNANGNIKLKYVDDNNSLKDIMDNNLIENVYTYFATGITGDFISFTLFIKNQPYGQNPQISYYINDEESDIKETYNMIYIVPEDDLSEQINKLTIYTFGGAYTIYIPYSISTSDRLLDIKNKNNILLVKENIFTNVILNSTFNEVEVNYLQYQQEGWKAGNWKPNTIIKHTISINGKNYILDNSSHEITITNSNIVTIDISTNNINDNNISYYIQFLNRIYNENYDDMNNRQMFVNNSNFYHKDIFSNNNIMSFYINTKKTTNYDNTIMEINQTIDSFKIKFS
tara:strand:- start:335 stop:1984 length:1650 start_codon:yes stop_codon:yes gene_type:complete